MAFDFFSPFCYGGIGENFDLNGLFKKIETCGFINNVNDIKPGVDYYVAIFFTATEQSFVMHKSNKKKHASTIDLYCKSTNFSSYKI